MQKLLVNRILELADLYPNKEAVRFKREALTYRELSLAVVGMAQILKKEQFAEGSCICFSAVSKPEMIVTYLAIQMSGCIAVYLDKNATAKNMYDIYEIADAKLMLTDKPMKEYADHCHHYSLKTCYDEARKFECDLKEVERIEYDEENSAEILFTSGTTGKAKGVVLSYKSVFHILKNTIEGIGINDEVNMLMPLPLHHSFALRVVRAVLYAGGTLTLQNGFIFAKEVENNIVQYACNAMACVPASYEVMKSQMQDQFDSVMRKLHFIEFGAGSLSIQQRREITDRLPEVIIFNTWGSSESGGAIFCKVTEAVKDEKTIGMLGRPLAGSVEVKTVDAEGNEFVSDASHPGRMALKGHMTMSGYWKNPEMTKAALNDEWLMTGDMIYIENGNVFMLGRADDIINVGGEKVSPIEVENIACQYEGIKECACIGVNDPKGVLGFVPALFVVKKASFDENSFKKFLSERMEKYKMPQIILAIDSLPRNGMQKIDRKKLSQKYMDSLSGDLMNPVVSNILARHSIRKFTDQEIPRDILDMILRCGYHAPSGHNMQTWRFTVLTDAKSIDTLKEKTKECANKNKVHFYGWENPKVLILVSNDQRNVDGCQDASCAAENMMLAANSYGIGAVWLNPLMTLRTKEPVEQILTDFGVPKNHIVWATIALGYPAADPQILKKKENVVRFADEAKRMNNLNYRA